MLKKNKNYLFVILYFLSLLSTYIFLFLNKFTTTLNRLLIVLLLSLLNNMVFEKLEVEFSSKLILLISDIIIVFLFIVLIVPYYVDEVSIVHLSFILLFKNYATKKILEKEK